MIFTHTIAEPEQKWSVNDLMNAVSEKHSKNLSYHKAASMFQVPKSYMIVENLMSVINKVHQQRYKLLKKKNWSSMLCT